MSYLREPMGSWTEDESCHQSLCGPQMLAEWAHSATQRADWPATKVPHVSSAICHVLTSAFPVVDV